MLPVLGAYKKTRGKKRRLDNAVVGTSKSQNFFVTTTAGEDETSEANPRNSSGDAVDVAPPVPVPEDEACSGGTGSGRIRTTWTGSSLELGPIGIPDD